MDLLGQFANFRSEIRGASTEIVDTSMKLIDCLRVFVERLLCGGNDLLGAGPRNELIVPLPRCQLKRSRPGIKTFLKLLTLRGFAVTSAQQ